MPHDELAAPDVSGHPGLRTALASYLARSRAVRCTPDDLLVTHGSTDAMTTLVRVLRAAGHRALLVEDPSWPRLRDVAAAAGLTPVPVPVDAEGVDARALVTAAERTGARLALITPAHQFPVGTVLAPGRRDAVVRWAQDVDGLVIEDDYDAEFRYDRRPVGTLQGVAPDHVALLGSLSKTLSPAFALGWAVLPPALRASVAQARAAAPSTIDQLTLARFLHEGGYERHLRSTRRRYARRRDALLAALAARLPGCEVSGVAAGMHVVLALPPGATGADVARRASLRGATLTDARRYRMTPTTREALVVGYGNLADARLAEAVDVLGAAVDDAVQNSTRDLAENPAQHARPTARSVTRFGGIA
ncbi:hypothetical protein Slu03_01160 [Sediminihabitans luteus]|nr:hypothetical protein Slu03_01160 [Sediminihabitans luteus]